MVLISSRLWWGLKWLLRQFFPLFKVIRAGFREFAGSLMVPKTISRFFGKNAGGFRLMGDVMVGRSWNVCAGGDGWKYGEGELVF